MLFCMFSLSNMFIAAANGSILVTATAQYSSLWKGYINKNKFLKIYAFISYQYNIFSKLKKIEFRGYYINRLVLQRKIKAWSRNNLSCHK